MRLSNEGWPSNPHFERIFHARNEDISWRAQRKVAEIYNDEYYSVRAELEIIEKIR